MAESVIEIHIVEADNRSILNGSFSIDSEDELFKKNSLHNSLIMSITYNSGYLVERPFKDLVLFEEDVERTEKNVSGRFNLDINKYIAKKEKNKYYIMFSIGRYLSNILKVRN